MAVDNVSRTYNRLRQQHGFTHEQAAALVARFQQESGPGLNTAAHGDRNLPGGSHGIAQWNRDRLDGLKRFAGDRDWRDIDVQTDYAAHELNTTERAAGDRLRNARNPVEMKYAAMDYERPQGWTRNNPAGGHGWGNTVANYNRLDQRFGGGNTAATAPVPGTTLTSRPASETPGALSPVSYDQQVPPPAATAAPATAAPDAEEAPKPGIVETIKDKGWAAGIDQALGDEKFIAGLGALAEGFGGGGGGSVQAQQRPPVAPLQVEPDDSAQRMAAAQPLLASLLAKRRRVPGLSLNGVV